MLKEIISFLLFFILFNLYGGTVAFQEKKRGKKSFNIIIGQCKDAYELLYEEIYDIFIHNLLNRM